MVVGLDRIVAALDGLFDLDRAAPDIAMSRHLPRVYEDAGVDWRAFVEPRFAERFNGLMHQGDAAVGTVYGACLPSAEVLDAWLAAAERGDLLVTHHPIDIRNGTPENDTWADGFVPISAAHRQAITARGLSMYSCHAPMDTSLRVGTAAAIVESFDGAVVDRFWPYGDGHAGLIADIPAITSAELVERSRDLFGVTTVEVEGRPRDDITRIAVVGGVGDHVDQMQAAEQRGAHAYLTGELHVRIEGEYGRRKFADVKRFAARTGMTLIGVSHAASEHLVIETQLARWLHQTLSIDLRPIRELQWWR
jgi:putative NIF3 family GTP cyclohydrolase 1 type 2